MDGGEGGTDSDTLDLRSWGKALTNIIYDPLNPENGTVQFLDAFGSVIGSMTFSNIENVIPCFTPGTLIDTVDGPLAVEDLRAGDRVLTRDNGYQPIRWAGSKRIDGDRLRQTPALQPVMIRQGALGAGLPLRDMRVSPQHRMLIVGPRAELLFGETEVLVAAKHLCGRTGIEQLTAIGVTYLHLLFDQHEIIRADGCWSESFQPGAQSLRGVGIAQCCEILAIFPELADHLGARGFETARLSLKAHEAKALLAA